MSNGTAWFDRSPGQFVRGLMRAVEVETEMGPAVLVGDLAVPDRVRLPPELGGGKVRVVGSFRACCPKHEPGRWGEPGETLVLDLGKLMVAECVTCGFVFFSFGERR